MSPRTPDDVPRIPRGKGIKLSFPLIMRIAMVATVLVALIVMQKPCADAVSKFVIGMDQQRPPTSEPAAVPAAGTPSSPKTPDPYVGPYIEITPGMTEEQIKAAVEKARTSR